MKNSIVMLMLAMAAVTGTAAAAIVDVIPSQQQDVVGGVVTVDVVISDLKGTAVGGFDFDLAYDSAVLSFSGVTFSDELNDPTDPWIDTLRGFDSTVNVYEVSDLIDLSTQATEFALATITFNAVAEGSSDLIVSINSLSDGLAGDIDVTAINNGAAEIVPEPATLLLALAGAGFIRRKRS